MLSKKVIAASVFLAATLLIFLIAQRGSGPVTYEGSGPATGASAKDLQEVQKALVLAQGAARSPTSIAVVKVNPQSVSVNMRKEFELTQNYSEFIRAALSRPEEGGKFYAALAYFRCFEVVHTNIESLPLSQNLNPRQAAALETLRDRARKCTDVLTHYPDMVTFTRILGNKDRKDPMFESTARLQGEKRDDPNYWKDDFERALASGDPNDLAWSVENYMFEFSSQLDKRLSQPEFARIRLTVGSSIACEIADNCETVGRYLVWCVLAEGCPHPNYKEMLVANLSKSEFQIYTMLREITIQKLGLRDRIRS